MHEHHTTNPERLNEIMPEISPELAATYETKDPTKKYIVGCGDDRYPTQESQDVLSREGLDSSEAYIRYYGALAGIGRVLAVTLIAEGKQAQLSALGDTFTEVIVTAKNAVEATSNVTLAMHSAEANEGQAERFDPTSEQGLGCAYAANTGVIAEICCSDNHRSVTIGEGECLFDTGTTADTVHAANRAFADQYFNSSDVHGLNRQDYVALGAPVQILKGAHAAPATTRVVINFTPNKLSNPGRACDRGQPAYDTDVTQVAELLLRAFPQLDLSPEILLAVMDQDIRATRTALADGHPQDLKLERLGDPKEALAYLTALKQSL